MDGKMDRKIDGKIDKRKRRRTLQDKAEERRRRGEAHPMRHDIVGMAGSMLLVILFSVIASALWDILMGRILYSSVDWMSPIPSALVGIGIYLLFLLLHWRHLRRREGVQHFWELQRTGAGLLLGWSILATGAATAVFNYVAGQEYGNPAAALLLGLEPGIKEEILFRIVPISLAMSSRRRKKLVMTVFVFTGLVFGLTHGLNLLVGADPVNTLIQVIYATGIGLLFAAIYLRTGNLWITILLHSLFDAVYFLGAAAQQSGGVLTEAGSTTANAIVLIYAVFYYLNAFWIFRRSRRGEVLQTWGRMYS